MPLRRAAGKVSLKCNTRTIAALRHREISRAGSAKGVGARPSFRDTSPARPAGAAKTRPDLHRQPARRHRADRRPRPCAGHCRRGCRPRRVTPIIVTANRRAENLQDVPVSAATLSTGEAQTIFDGGADVTALAARVPGLFVESSNGRAAPRFSIRGLGNTDFDLAASQPVSVVMDDVVMENVTLKSFPIFSSSSSMRRAGAVTASSSMPSSSRPTISCRASVRATTTPASRTRPSRSASARSAR